MVAKRPAKIGKYDVIDVIGRGGMGIVYKATDPFLDRLVAIKMMTGAYADNPELLKRFFREAQSTGSLQHPNIVTVFELGDHEGNPYLVMEFLEGESLDSIITSRRELTLLEKINLMVEVCHGLNHAHHRGIVHRDIKPANIMVSKEGAVKIVDFGIAHMAEKNVTKTGQIMGSVSYMAPEQVNGKPVDARTDIFSTGVVLYQLLTYSHPFDGESTAATLLKIIHDAPPPLKNYVSEYPPELETIISKALAKDREERYHSAEDLALDLGQLQGHLKQELVANHLRQVSLLLEEADLYKAKDQLLQALKIDRQNTEANLLLREVQQRIQKQQIREQVQQLRVQAEEAFNQQQFETALGHLERAAALDANNVELQHLRQSIQTAWSCARELHEKMKRAEAAHQAGDLDSAKQAVEEALELAPEAVQATTLYHAIQRDWVERARQRQLENFLEQARREIAGRNFTSALEILKQAEAVEPGAPQVRALIESATLGREQEQRRRELDAINHQIEEALNRDGYATACRRADEGLERFPEDRTLLKLKAMAEKQRHIAERKQYVDEQLASARTLFEQGRNEELLSLLQAALAKAGPEPRLQSLLLIVRENVEHERTERRKAEYLQKAKDALRQKSFDEAIRILETAREELKDSTEVADLLQFAKEEAVAEQRRLMVEATAQKANAFIAGQEYEQAIKLLETTLKEVPDEELHIILAEARRASLEYQRKLETTLGSAEKLLQSRKASEALRLLEAHSSLLARSTAFQKLVETARSESERLRLIDEFIGRSSQALENEDYAAARSLLEQCRQLHGSTPELEQRLNEVAAKQSTAAAAVIQKAISDAQILANASQYEPALEKLKPASDLLAFASPAMKSEYENLRQEAADGLTHQRVAQFESLIAAGEFTQAEKVLRQTLLLFPGHRDLRGLEDVLREETGRRAEAQQAITDAQKLFRKGDWKRGGELLKKAFSVAGRAPKVREEVLASLLHAAETAFEKDWHASEALLQVLSELKPNYQQPPALQSQITQRKRQEFVSQCRQQAKRLQLSGDLQGALREIERGLSSYADESGLLDLRTQIQEQIRQEEERIQRERARREQEVFVQGVTQRAQSEPVLEHRIHLLEEALARYPQEPRLEQQLNQTYELWKRVKAILNEAHRLEEAKKYEEATGQWDLLRSVHAQHPELDNNLSRVRKLAEQARAAAKAEWIRGVQAALASADYDRVLDLINHAKTKFGGDREVSDFEKKLQEGLKLRTKAQKIIADAHAALGKKKWEKAAGYLQRACEVAGADRPVREHALAELLEGCEAALDVDSPSAEMLLARAAEIQPDSPLLSALRARIESHKREQLIQQHMTAAVSAQSTGDLQGALRQLDRGLSAYPNEPRLLQVKGDIETRLRKLEEERQQQREVEKERARHAELERQRQIELKRKRELEREQAKAAEQAQKLARARELEQKAEQERIRQREAELQRQQELERKRNQEAEQARAKAAEREREVARARELELKRQQELDRERELERQREAELKQREEEQRAREKAEKKRLAAQKIAEKARRREEESNKRVVEKTVVIPPAQAFKHTRTLVVGGSAVLLGVVALAIWVFMPHAVLVEITTTPVGSRVRIKSTGEECVTPKCSIKLRPGKYEMEISHQGYETKTQPITVVAKTPNSFSVELQLFATNKGPTVPPPPAIKPATVLIRGWSHGSKVFVDGSQIGSIDWHGTFSTTVAPEPHEIKVMDKNGESGTMHKLFATGESADLAKKDFVLGRPPIPPRNPPPNPPSLALSAEDRDWQQVKDSASIAELEKFRDHYPKSRYQGDLQEKLDNLYWDKARVAGTVASLDEYLGKFPNGRYREQAQENVAWKKAEASDTVQAFRDYQMQYPQGAHFDSARRKIEDLRFQAARNSEDEAVLQSFLMDYPSGELHDQIYNRLDDVVWEKTRKDDPGSLQAYLSRMTAGRHVSQARYDIEKLNAPKATKEASKPALDDKAAVLKVIAEYNQAYNDRDIDALKKVWPNMGQKQISAERDFFKTASSVTSSYNIEQGPQINGDEATVRVMLTFNYVMNGKEERAKPSRVTITLKKAGSLSSTPIWQIQSIGK
jgi:eukaryotic-like serine/threonine-protein kinase